MNTHSYLRKDKEYRYKRVEELNDKIDKSDDNLRWDSVFRNMLIRQLSSRIDVILELYLSVTDHLLEPNLHLYESDVDFSFMDLCMDKHQLLSHDESKRFKEVLDGIPFKENTLCDEIWLQDFYLELEKRIRNRLKNMRYSK